MGGVGVDMGGVGVDVVGCDRWRRLDRLEIVEQRCSMSCCNDVRRG